MVEFDTDDAEPFATSYYARLGASPDHDADELETIGDAVLRDYHPHVTGGGDDARTAWNRIQEARDVLQDADERAVYDVFVETAGAETGTELYEKWNSKGRPNDAASWVSQATSETSASQSQSRGNDQSTSSSTQSSNQSRRSSQGRHQSSSASGSTSSSRTGAGTDAGNRSGYGSSDGDRWEDRNSRDRSNRRERRESWRSQGDSGSDTSSSSTTETSNSARSPNSSRVSQTASRVSQGVGQVFGGVGDFLSAHLFATVGDVRSLALTAVGMGGGIIAWWIIGIVLVIAAMLIGGVYGVVNFLVELSTSWSIALSFDLDDTIVTVIMMLLTAGGLIAIPFFAYSIEAFDTEDDEWVSPALYTESPFRWSLTVPPLLIAAIGLAQLYQGEPVSLLELVVAGGGAYAFLRRVCLLSTPYRQMRAVGVFSLTGGMLLFGFHQLFYWVVYRRVAAVFEDVVAVTGVHPTPFLALAIPVGLGVLWGGVHFAGSCVSRVRGLV